MTVKSISTSLLALACAATALAQTATSPGVRRLPARPIRQASTTAQTNDTPSGVRQLPARSSSLSRSSSASAPSVTTPYIAPTAKSDDLVESPATNVIKGAFGYTLGAIWDEPIPEDAKPVVEKYDFRRTTVPEPPFGRLGEVTFDVGPKTTILPFESVTLCVSTNEHRIAAIAARSSRTMLAESFTETREKIGEIAREVAGEFGIDSFAHSIVTNANAIYSSYPNSPVIVGKLYREFLKGHPDDPDQGIFKKVVLQNILKHSFHLIAGSRYNATPLGRSETAHPDYLQQIWQPLELVADYYPYAGDTVIRFSVRDVEDRTEHTNLVSVAELKRKLADEAAKRTEETEKRRAAIAAAPGIRRLPSRTTANHSEQPQQSEEEKASEDAMKKAAQAFKDSLYRLSFAEAVEKAKDNDPEALLRIALAYIDGTDVNSDYREGRKYLEKACSQNYGYAQLIFGLAESSATDWSRFCNRCRNLGLGTRIDRVCSEDDIHKAIQHFEQAVSNGVSFAQSDLDYAREKLKAAEEEEARKNKNAELLRGSMEGKSQEEDSTTIMEPTPQPAESMRKTPIATPSAKNEAQPDPVQNICGIPLGGKLKDVKNDPCPKVNYYSVDEVKDDNFKFDSVLIQNVRHFGGWNPTHKIQLLENDFVFSGECTIGDDTIFNAKLGSERYAHGNPWRYVSETEKTDSDSSKLVRKLRETLVLKYGEPQYVRQKSDKHPTLSVCAWRNKNLVIILSYDARFYKQASGLFSDNGKITLQYIREDLLQKAKAESDAYEAAKKAEAEHKAKADAEAWPEEMKKAMESL